MPSISAALFRFARVVLVCIRGLATALGILLLVITFTPVLRYWVSALSAQWGSQDGDTLIVLGGDLTSPGMLGAGSYWRSYYTDLVWREGHFRRVVITGKTVAPLMRDFIVCEGVPANVFTIENQATSTRENALFVARLLAGDKSRKVLLTSDYHMGRALRAFRKAGIDASPIPFPDALKQMNNPVQRWSVFCRLVEETARVAYYKEKGWI